jgi:FkbM family methyltransferase
MVDALVRWRGQPAQDHMLGKIKHRLGILAGARRTSGLLVAARWYMERVRQDLKISPGSPWRVRPHQVDFSLIVRRGSASDLRVFEQIFVEDEYECLKNLGDIGSIVDLGANVGYSSAYFLSAFPAARVLAVEPFQPSFEVMRANLAPYGQRSFAVHGAAWCERTRVSLRAGDYTDWAKQVDPAKDGSAGTIEAYDVASLLEMAGMETVDLLKVDIEGAEMSVFGAGAARWLPQIRNICVELHGPECRQTFFKALEGFDYDLSWSGELTICRNLTIKNTLPSLAPSSQ